MGKTKSKSSLVRATLVVAVAFSVMACGGRTSAATDILIAEATGVTPGYERINGILVPPEPNPSENNKTFQGVDLDGNGVRDDMDRWAAKKFGHVPAVIHPIHMAMKSEQDVLSANPKSMSEALDVLKESIDFGVCGGDVVRNNGFDFGKILDEVALRTLNTRERIKKFKQVTELAGPFTTEAGSKHKNCMY